MAGRRQGPILNGVLLALADALIYQIEEGFIFLNGSSERCSKIIFFELRIALRIAGGVKQQRWRRIKEITSVQVIIAQVFEGIAVKTIGSTFADHHHLSAHGVAIFGAE